MIFRVRWPVVCLLIAMVLSACGDNSAPSDAAPIGEQQSGTAGSGSGEASTGDDGPSGDSGGPDAPEIDTADMPPPGEAHVSVNGESFVFKQSEMIEGVFACEVRDNGITINFQSDRHDLLVQGAFQADGSIIANATVVPEQSDFRYSSTTAGDNDGAVSVEGNQVLYVSRFDATPKDDLASFKDVGIGTVKVTCP